VASVDLIALAKVETDDDFLGVLNPGGAIKVLVLQNNSAGSSAIGFVVRVAVTEASTSGVDGSATDTLVIAGGATLVSSPGRGTMTGCQVP